jgi:hypothetical protein
LVELKPSESFEGKAKLMALRLASGYGGRGQKQATPDQTIAKELNETQIEVKDSEVIA